MTLDKNRFDVSQAFQTFLTFGGDVVRTAVALNVSAADISSLAVSENWSEKVRQWDTLKAGSSADVAIAVNRASCFVTAKRLQDLVNRVINHLSTMDPERLVDYLSPGAKQRKDGSVTVGAFSAKPLTELAKAAESCALMASRALGDTVAERPETGSVKGSSIALMVQAAMSASESAGTSPVLLVREQIAEQAPPAR